MLIQLRQQATHDSNVQSRCKPSAIPYESQLLAEYVKANFFNLDFSHLRVTDTERADWRSIQSQSMALSVLRFSLLKRPSAFADLAVALVVLRPLVGFAGELSAGMPRPSPQEHNVSRALCLLGPYPLRRCAARNSSNASSTARRYSGVSPSLLSSRS